MPRIATLIILVFFVFNTQAAAPVVDSYNLQERVERLERGVEGKKGIDLLAKLNQQQDEMRELHGQMEQQTYQIEQLKKSQTQIYLDLDKRLSVLEEKKQ